LLGNRRNASRDRVIDTFEMPLPVTADKWIEAGFQEDGIAFVDNTPRVTLYCSVPAESPALEARIMARGS
jgi:hypothetical protein